MSHADLNFRFVTKVNDYEIETRGGKFEFEKDYIT